MKKFTVQAGLVKQANRLLVNSNKLENVFYNIGNKFLCNDNDLSEIKTILKRNFIKIEVTV